MSIGDGGRRGQQTKSHAVRSASQNALWQSETSDLEHRSTVLTRDRILFWVGLSLIRLQQGTRGPAAAPPTVNRLRDPSVVAGHGRQDRSDAWHRGSSRRGTAADKGSTNDSLRLVATRYAPTSPPSVNRPGRTNVTHRRRSVTGISNHGAK